MKNFFRLGLISCMFLLCLFLPKLNAAPTLDFFDAEPQISMDFQDANLKDILKVFSIQSGLNFIASEGVQERRITLFLDKVPLQMAMDNLFKANNLSYELDRKANIFIVKDWGKLEVETITRVFSLKYATVSSSSLKEEMASQMTATTAGSTTGGTASGGGGASGGGSGKWAIEEDTGITKAVKKLLSEVGSVIEDFRTNSLVVTDTPGRMKVIVQTIAALDVSVPEALIEIEMLDVSKSVVDKMGIKFGQTPFSISLTGNSATTGFPFKSWGKISSPGEGTLSINSTAYTAQLDFLRTHTDTKYLARPKILTLNNETAEIRIATDESIGIKTTTSETGGTTAEAERAETGVILRITPQINVETGEITMFVYPKVSEAVQGNTLTSGTGSYQYRDPEERSTKSMVRVKDGETVVLGGLIRNEFTQIKTKVPILGDLPLVGLLFRHKGGTSDKDRERELLVFITPHIVKDKAAVKLAQTKKVALPEREQSTASRVNRESAINSSLSSFEKKKR